MTDLLFLSRFDIVRLTDYPAYVETVEADAHTPVLSPGGDRLYAFLPHHHRAALYHVTRTNP